ncbi:ATP-binding cassette domain-containing protein [bacterium]|nr:ATP-binding cassette domain-containing protein [bacterium]
MLLLKGISKQFSGQTILDNVSLPLSKHITALVGKNGSGKSTLMKIISGAEYCDSGEITFKKNAVIEYLPQQAVYHFKGTVFEEVAAGLDSSRLESLHSEQAAIIEKIDSSKEPDEKLLIRLNEIIEEIHRLEVKVKQKNSVENILLNLGFERSEWEKPASTMSGGWQMRIALARVLVKEPDIIMLDEPTNYLDIVTIDFLAGWLKRFDGQVLLVSHDRDFLNDVAEETWEIFNGEITIYKGNYDFYLKEREAKIALLEKQREKQLVEIRDLQDYYDKNHTNAAHAALAQSKLKMLEKLKSELIVLPQKAPTMTFRLPEPKRGGEIVAELSGITHKFGDLEVISNYKRIVRRGERIALVGRNGFGKSTLLNIIGQELQPTAGICRIGAGIEICYFRQHEISKLPSDMTVQGFVESIAPFEMMTKIKNILGCFLFFEDDWDKKIAVLSGGEKVRLAFIKFIMTPGNLLLLDEPTTHLDIDSKEILLSTLKSIPATIIFVSHDSHFINSLATSIVYFRKRGDIFNFEGTYSEYLDMYGHETISEETEPEKPKTSAPKTEEVKGKIDFAQQKEIRNRLNKLKKEIENLQDKIDSLEKEKQEICDKISASFDPALASRLGKIEDELLELMEKWEEKSIELEKISENQPVP